jgi:S1-C subfamily serine protease
MTCAARASLLALLLIALPGARADDTSRLPDAVALQAAMQKAIEKAEPSIACILVARGDDRHGFDPEKADFVPEIYGSGVVIDEKGLVLTNEHVIRGATARYVRLPGEKGGFASLLAADQRSDLAVLKIDQRLIDQRLLTAKPLALGHGEKLRKGQFVLSLANPFAAGFRDGSPSASWGIISNLRRRAPLDVREERNTSDKPLNQFGTLIQTDARINLGCSGGALIDLDGKLVGLTTALAALNGSETPGGFAVPLDVGVRRIIDRLRQGEEVEYGFLGVRWDPGRIVRRGDGVFVECMAGGPAAAANIPATCLILAINGHRIRDVSDMTFYISTALAGTTVKVEWRGLDGGLSQTSEVKLAKLYIAPERFIATKRPPLVGGLRVDYTSTLASRLADPFGRQAIPRGVVVREVQPNSPADKAQIQVDKVITRVNGKEVATPTDFYLAVDAATGGTLELTIQGRSDKVRLPLR